MSASYLARVKTDISCPLCLELFVDPNTPKQLKCPHVYCRICLEKITEGDVCVVTCPDCRAVTRVPPKTPTSDGGIADLKTSIQLRSLAENHLKHIEKQRVLPSVKTGAKPSSLPTCPDHDEEKMHFYCVTCKVIACQACVLLDHDKTTHEIKGVKVVYKEKQLAGLKKRMEIADDSCKCQDLLKSVMEQENTVEAIMAGTVREIDQAVAEVLVKVKEQEKSVKEKLKEIKRGQLQVYQQQKERLEHDIQVMRTIKVEVESTMENASPFEYLRKHDSLEEKFEKIQIDRQGSKIEIIEVATVSKWVPKPIVQLGEWVRLRELKPIQKIEGNIGIFNVGGMNGTLALRNYNCVSIYHKQQTGKYKHELDVDKNGSDEARDVAVAANGKILVDMKDSVRVYSACGQYESTFYTTRDKNTQNIALTSITLLHDGRVVIADDGRRVLTVHTPDGELIKTIVVGFVQRSITAMKGAQVATCGWNGNFYVYDVDTGRADALIANVPGVWNLCYDEQTDCLMVGNYDGRIEQYCVSPWKLINTNRVVEGIPRAMIFADKDDLVVHQSPTEIRVYSCTG